MDDSVVRFFAIRGQMDHVTPFLSVGGGSHCGRRGSNFIDTGFTFVPIPALSRLAKKGTYIACNKSKSSSATLEPPLHLKEFRRN